MKCVMWAVPSAISEAIEACEPIDPLLLYWAIIDVFFLSWWLFFDESDAVCTCLSISFGWLPYLTCPFLWFQAGAILQKRPMGWLQVTLSNIWSYHPDVLLGCTSPYKETLIGTIDLYQISFSSRSRTTHRVLGAGLGIEFLESITCCFWAL